MQRHAVGQGNDPQVAVDFAYPDPMPDATVLRLHLAPQRVTQGFQAPFQLDVWPLFQHVVPGVVGHRLHDSMLPANRYPVKPRPDVRDAISQLPYRGD